MGSETQHNLSPLMDFNPELHLDELDVQLQFEQLVADMQSIGNASPVHVNNDVISQFTTLNDDSDLSDLFEGDIDMTAPWISTNFSGGEAVLTKSPSPLDENSEAQSPDLPENDIVPLDFEFTLPADVDDMLMDLDANIPAGDTFSTMDQGFNWPSPTDNDIDMGGAAEADDQFSEFDIDFNDFGTPGVDQPGSSFLDPLTILDSPPQLSMSGFSNQAPGDLDTPTLLPAAPLTNDAAGPAKGKGRFYLLKGGKTVLSVPPEGLGPVLGGLAKSRSTVSFVNQHSATTPPQQQLWNPPLPEFDFEHSDVVDGPVPGNGPASGSWWTLDLDNPLPPSRAAPPQGRRDVGLNQGNSIAMTEAQERELAQVMADVPRRNLVLLNRAQNRNPPRNRSEALARARMIERQRHRAILELRALRQQGRERAQAKLAHERNVAHIREQDERARRREQARRDHARREKTRRDRLRSEVARHRREVYLSERARRQAERIRALQERDDSGHSYSESLSPSTSPSPPPARAAPRHPVADRCGAPHRSDRDRDGDQRPLTRNYARKHGVSLKLPDFSS